MNKITAQSKLAIWTLFVMLNFAGQHSLPVARAHSQSRASLIENPADLSLFVDEFVTQQLAEQAIPGAAIVIVQNDEIVYANGYGVADLIDSVQVSAGRTVFRTASISKLFVATAIMQLVEAGTLDLHADVNRYLKSFQLTNQFERPLTLHHLLTHTGGFDDLYVGSLTLEESQRIELGDYLAKRMPPRIMPPGEVTSYSNHGFALAALIAEEVTGVPFWQYTEEHIITPLKMKYSGYLIAPDWSANLAVGYKYESGALKSLPYEYFHRYPSSSFMATATDMAHFIIAQLNAGQFEDNTILRSESIQTMQQQQFSHHHALTGMGYGFFESFERNQRLLWHDGSTGGFNSDLVLIPDARIGYFITTNSRQGSQLTRPFREAFLDFLYPVERASANTRDNLGSGRNLVAGDLDRFAGSYQYNRYSRTTIEKVEQLVNDKLVVSIAQDSLFLDEKEFTAIEPLLFQDADTGNQIAFRADEDGQITHLFIGPFAFEKLFWHQQSWFHFGLVGFCLIVFGSTIAWAFVNTFLPRYRCTFEAPFSKYMVWGSAGIGLFKIGLAISMFTILSSVAVSETMRSHVPPIVISLLVGALISAFLAGVSAFIALAVWVRRDVSYWQCIHYTLMAIASAAIVWFLHYWNLLGFRYPL
ncbi:MAG: serine hydrolase domain-containing protein [Chloroflexota bacterium]